MTLRIDVVTIFPGYFAPLEQSLLGKARERGLLTVTVHDLRDWATGPHRSVDDAPYGGGPGMLMRPEPWAWAEAAVTLLRAAFPNDSWEVASWPACDRLLPHLLAAAGHAERLGIAGEAASWLSDRASAYLRERGQYRQAKPLAERAVTLAEAALGPDDLEVAWRRDALGRVLHALGDFSGAREQFERALAIGEAALGPDHRDVGTWRNNLGAVLRDLGDLPGAREQFERALAISEAALGPDHPDVRTIRGNLNSVTTHR